MNTCGFEGCPNDSDGHPPINVATDARPLGFTYTDVLEVPVRVCAEHRERLFRPLASV